MKVLVSDFDLTIYPKAYAENIKLANQFIAAGNVFIIATGRNLKSLLNRLEGTNLNYSYLICNDGGVIYDKNHNVVYKTNLDLQTAKEIFTLLINYNKEAKIDNGYELDTVVKDEVNKLLVRYEDETTGKLLLDQVTNQYPSVHGYLSTNYINIVELTVSKASAINYLAQMNQYKDIYVVGDNVNDISMFKEYYGYSIDTSIEEIRKLSKRYVNSFIDVIKDIEKDD